MSVLKRMFIEGVRDCYMVMGSGLMIGMEKEVELIGIRSFEYSVSWSLKENIDSWKITSLENYNLLDL